MIEGILKQFFLIGLEEKIEVFEDLLFIFHELIVDALFEAEDVVIYFIVFFCLFLEYYYLLVAFLFCLCQGLCYVHVCWFCVLDEVLLCMLDDAVGT